MIEVLMGTTIRLDCSLILVVVKRILFIRAVREIAGCIFIFRLCKDILLDYLDASCAAFIRPLHCEALDTLLGVVIICSPSHRYGTPELEASPCWNCPRSAPWCRSNNYLWPGWCPRLIQHARSFVFSIISPGAPVAQQLIKSQLRHTYLSF